MRFKLNRLEVEGFRSYGENTTFDFYPNLTVVYGKNGQGKSTLYDAILWLFNNDLTRFIDYGNEWRRARKSHTRCWFFPEKASHVKAVFENQDNTALDYIDRRETGLKRGNTLASWFSNAAKNSNLLWTHLLHQNEIQDLALATGRERLEKLAPMLDLMKGQEEIRSLSAQVSALQKRQLQIKDILNNLKALNESTIIQIIESSGTNLANKISNSGIRLQDRADIATIQEWKNWADASNSAILQHHGEIASQIGVLQDKYNIPDSVDPVNIESDNLEHAKQDVIFLQNHVNAILGNINTNDNILNLLNHYKGRVDQEFETLRYSQLGSDSLHHEVAILQEQKSELVAKANCISLEKQIGELTKEIEENKHVLYQYKSQCEKATEAIVRANAFIAKRQDVIQSIQQKKEWVQQNVPNGLDEYIVQAQIKLDSLSAEHKLTTDRAQEIEHARRVLLEHQAGNDGCPLCGQLYESRDALIKAIDSQTEKWKKQLDQMAYHLRVLFDELAEAKYKASQKVVFLREISAGEQELNTINQAIVNVQNTIKGTIVMLGLEYDLSEEETSWINLHSLIDAFSKKEIRKLESRLDDYQEQLSKKKEELHQIVMYREENARILNQKNEEIAQLLETQNNAYANIETIMKACDIHENPKAVDEVKIKKSIDSSLNKITLDNIRLRKELNEANSKLAQKELAHLTVLRRKAYQVQQLLKEQAGFSASIASAEADYKTYKDRLSLESELRNISKELTQVKTHLNKAKEAQRFEIIKALGPLSRRISAIFELLTRSVLWKTVKTTALQPTNTRERMSLIFNPIARERTLNNNTASNATFLFSSGQMTGLGLAIFLAQATQEKNRAIGQGPELSTLFLDDPVQMLDSISDDALASLICDIARDRQVVVSTSDINFANRLLLMSRPIWNAIPSSCGLLHFEKIGSAGPKVRQVLPDQWMEEQKIYLPIAFMDRATANAQN